MTLQRTEFKAMGGNNEIVVAADQLTARQAIESAIGEIARIEAKYSRYKSDSLVSAINRLAGSGEFVTCDKETSDLLDFAEKLHADSDGLFDITSGILRHCWDFSKPEMKELPEANNFLPLVGWQKIEREQSAIRLPLKGMEIDFGGIGKEYAADRAASTLVNNGITHGYVNLGGDIRVVGPNPDGSPWLFGVANPQQPDAVMATIPLENGALATSGDYRKYIKIGGKKFAHILNPRTGIPVSHWASVTVTAPTALLAGSISTLLMLMEYTGLEFIKTTNLRCLLVDATGNTYIN